MRMAAATRARSCCLLVGTEPLSGAVVVVGVSIETISVVVDVCCLLVGAEPLSGAVVAVGMSLETISVVVDVEFARFVKFAWIFVKFVTSVELRRGDTSAFSTISLQHAM